MSLNVLEHNISILENGHIRQVDRVQYAQKLYNIIIALELGFCKRNKLCERIHNAIAF